jgi:hypothetical protein
MQQDADIMLILSLLYTQVAELVSSLFVLQLQF